MISSTFRAFDFVPNPALAQTIIDDNKLHKELLEAEHDREGDIEHGKTKSLKSTRLSQQSNDGITHENNKFAC